MITRDVICLLVLYCVASPWLAIKGQTPADKTRSRTEERSTRSDASKHANASKQEEADLLNEVRRSTVIALVSTLADEARDYQNETLRVRIQARAAETLWGTDPERAYTLFRRAWDAANTIDQAGEIRVKEDRRKLRTGLGGPTFIPRPPNLRLEVLRIVSRHDRALSEKFLASLEEKEDKESSDRGSETRTFNRWDPTEPAKAITKRLELGIQLIEIGDVQRAVQFADPALERVTQIGIVFLYKLQQKDAAAANQRFAVLLSRTVRDPLADANTVSLLSTYAFTPLIFATVTQNGRAYGGEAAPPPVLPAEVRSAFFLTAAQVLLRPLPPPDQDHTSAGRAGTYFVISRLLPLFQQYAPDKVPALSAHLSSLTQDTPAILRDDHAMRTVGFNSQTPPSDDLRALPDRLRTAINSDERDRIYVSVLGGMIKSDPRRAREIADKIENADLRKQAIAFIDFAAIQTALETKNTEEALRITRAGNLPSIQRVWGYIEITQLLNEHLTDIIHLLNEATAEAHRIDQSNPQRAQALTAIATRMFAVDRAQAWLTMADAVKAANTSQGFEGEAAKVTAQLQTGTMMTKFDLEAPSFNLAGIFSSFAGDDLQRTIELAKGFTAAELRAIAILAIARSVLDEKPQRRSRKFGN